MLITTTARPRVGRALLALLLVAGAGLGACMGDGPTAQQPSSHLRVIQAVPNAPALDLYVDSGLVLGSLGFRAITGFFPVTAGPRRVRLVTTNGVTTIVDDTVHFEFPRAYTMVTTGMMGDVQAIVAPDTAPIPQNGEFKVRVIQAAPIAGTVDVYITDAAAALASSTPVLSAVPFRGNTDYFTLPVGRNRIRITASGTLTVLLDVTQIFGERSMRTIVATDAPGGGFPLTGMILIDY